MTKGKSGTLLDAWSGSRSVDAVVTALCACSFPTLVSTPRHDRTDPSPMRCVRACGNDQVSARPGSGPAFVLTRASSLTAFVRRPAAPIRWCQTLRFNHRVDLGDLSVGNGECHHREQSTVGRDHCSSGTVDQRRPYERIPVRVCRGMPGDGVGATENERRVVQPAAIIGARLRDRAPRAVPRSRHCERRRRHRPPPSAEQDLGSAPGIPVRAARG